MTEIVIYSQRVVARAGVGEVVDNQRMQRRKLRASCYAFNDITANEPETADQNE